MDGAVFGKNTFSINCVNEPLVPKLTLYMFVGKSVFDTILFPSKIENPVVNDEVATDIDEVCEFCTYPCTNDAVSAFIA